MRTLKMIFAALLVLAVVTLARQAPVAAPPSLIFLAGTVQPVGSGWTLISDTRHQPQGLGVPTCDAVTGWLHVPYLAPIPHVVGSAVMTDEDWSRAGIIAGASVGLTDVVVLFTRVGSTGPIPVSCSAMVQPGNLWVEVIGA